MNQQNGSKPILAYALSGLGVAGFAIAAWMRMGRDGGPGVGVTIASALVVVGGVLAWVWWRGRRAAGGQTVLADRLPGATLHQVWADASLSAALVTNGVHEPRMNPGGGTRFTLAWSPAGVELWRAGREPRQVLVLPWSEIAAVSEGVGQAGSSPRAAIVIHPAMGDELVVVPAAKPAGGLLPAPQREVERLVTDIRSVRDTQAGLST